MSGAWMLVSPQCWLEIQLVRVEDVLEVTVKRHRAVGVNTAWSPGTIPMAVENECLATAAPLTVEDVLEALTHVDPVIVEAMLFETRPSFAMRSSLLIELVDKGVPERIIDLMTALSFPNEFVIAGNTIRLAPEPQVEVYYYGYPGYGFFHPYYHYGYWYPRPPVHHPRGGTVINGLGYTRVHRAERSSGGTWTQSGGGGGSNGGGISAGSNGGGSTATASPSGHSSSSTSTRMAVRRD
jgi:uncharacterized membrane protein YgcG